VYTLGQLYVCVSALASHHCTTHGAIFKPTFCMADFVKFPMRFQVLMATSMKMTLFWVVAPFSLVEIDQCFRGTLIIEAVSISETSASFFEATWCNNPEDSHLQNFQCLPLSVSGNLL
jgi:hypothetical protein